VKKIILAAVFALVATTGANATCKSDAVSKDGKPLAGAALKSFMTKCEKDAKVTCTKDAADKKLNGAAKNSHIKKCTTDAVGT
jgi:hypothetical protein